MSIMDMLQDPARMIGVHSWLALLWLALTFGTTVLAMWFPEHPYLLAWVIFMSGYANVASHWSAREGAAPSAGEVAS
jgi:hypothetical protein